MKLAFQLLAGFLLVIFACLLFTNMGIAVGINNAVEQCRTQGYVNETRMTNKVSCTLSPEEKRARELEAEVQRLRMNQ